MSEKLLINKRGGIVALEPSTGEILALVSAPNYDPKMLVGRERSKTSQNYGMIPFPDLCLIEYYKGNIHQDLLLRPLQH